MDLEALYGRYTGLGRIKRLEYAAAHASNAATQAQALRLAVNAVVADSTNANAYRELTTSKPAAGFAFDSATFERLQRAAENKIRDLSKEVEIGRARNQRDAVRTSSIQLGLAYRDMGDVTSASTVLSTAREYVAHAGQMVEINSMMLEMTLLMLGGDNAATRTAHQYTASNLVNKLHSSPEADKPQ
jgi:hypothetical protein